MPSRKSLSSDAAPSSDSRRASMKRLSSIASLAHLNPFNRRRSNNATDSTASCSSEVSLPTAITTTTTTSIAASGPRKLSESSSTIFSDTAPLVAPAIPIESQASFLRRSSYVCLPDDPIGGMPRSRTFSNLPLPTRSKKTASHMPTALHTREPSTFTASTRLPTPPASTRRHLISNGTGPASRYQNVRNRMKRSDTMPLLSVNVDQVSNLPRPTVFKENISLSPIKPLPELEPFELPEFSSSLPAGSYMEDQLWEQTSSTVLPRDPSFSGALPIAPFPGGESPKRDKFNFYSSPAFHPKQAWPPRSSSFSRPPPVQRWNSQPVLTNTTNISANGHHEIRQTRLMSARQAPTPPLARTPLSMQAMGAPTTRVRGGSKSSAHHLRSSSTQTLLNSSSTPPTSAGQIHTAEPISYWCGRISALLDRYHNEELAESLSSTNQKSETDKLHTPSANIARSRRALEHLHSQCATEEARESFSKFQFQIASAQNLPELARPIKPRRQTVTAKFTAREAGIAVEKRSEPTAGEPVRSGIRKISIFDRMLGRREKRESIS